jgi:hypothetical protein
MADLRAGLGEVAGERLDGGAYVLVRRHDRMALDNQHAKILQVGMP